MTAMLLLLACSLAPTPTPAPEPTATVTATPTPTDTPKPTATPTPVVIVVTATPIPTASVPELLGNLYEVRPLPYFYSKIVERYGEMPVMADESGLWIEGGTKIRVFFYAEESWHMGTWAVVEGDWRWLTTEVVQPTPSPAPTPGPGREARK